MAFTQNDEVESVYTDSMPIVSYAARFASFGPQA